MKILIIMFVGILSFTEIIKDIEPEYKNNKCLFLIIQPMACHKCFVEIDQKIRKLNVRNFKYYILFEREQRVVDRKIKMTKYKSEYNLGPDKFGSPPNLVGNYKKKHEVCNYE